MSIVTKLKMGDPPQFTVRYRRSVEDDVVSKSSVVNLADARTPELKLLDIPYQSLRLNPPIVWTGADDSSNVVYVEPAFKEKAKVEEPFPYVHRPNYVGSMYLWAFINPKKLKMKIDLCVRALKPHVDTFDAIAFTGMSGCLIAPPVAMELGKEMLMVRKPDSSSHSSYEVEGDYNARTYIIVDDFRSSGAREERIIKAIKKCIPNASYMGMIQADYLHPSDVERAEETGQPIPLLERMERT